MLRRNLKENLKGRLITAMKINRFGDVDMSAAIDISAHHAVYNDFEKSPV